MKREKIKTNFETELNWLNAVFGGFKGYYRGFMGVLGVLMSFLGVLGF